MKSIKELIFIFAFVLLLLTFAQGIGPILNSPRGYRYIDGTAIEECPEGTHAYMSNPMGPTWSQRTCKEPVIYDMGGICDMSRCDCDEPTVLDETTDKCVRLEDCPPPCTQECSRAS